ncbi:hypothetical protein [Methanoculleus sp.]|uniref:hypothetical protein n=1 Tax=Methanoculleus sp. TaxID=90427 RepID=UPI0025DF673C|nr:hypothetical protein [Methanoculleus sp.]
MRIKEFEGWIRALERLSAEKAGEERLAEGGDGLKGRSMRNPKGFESGVRAP